MGRRILTNFWKTATIAVVVAYLSLRDLSNVHMPIAAAIPHFDKVVHFGMYLLLGIAWTSELRRARPTTAMWWWLLPPTLYGGLIEILQEYYFPPRTGSWLDLLADFVGVLAAILALHLWKKRKTS